MIWSQNIINNQLQTSQLQSLWQSCQSSPLNLCCMLDYLEFSVGKLREVARSFGIIFSLSSQKVLVWFCRRTSYCISGGIFADTHTHDPLGALDCNSNRVLPSFDHFTQKWSLLIESYYWNCNGHFLPSWT